METLYVSRAVMNWQDIHEWAASQGFTSTLADDMHVTIMFSRSPVDLDEAGDHFDSVNVSPSDSRTVKALGDQGAVVLVIDDPSLARRHQEFKDAGGVWSYDGYQQHVTISYETEGIDLNKVEPYGGKIRLGPERFKEINENWDNEIKEKRVTKTIAKSSEILKVDEELGLVFGFAIICKENGEDYYDLQDDYIPEATMLKASLDFAQNSNQAWDVHGFGEYGEERVGGYPFLFPLTGEIAKSLGIETNRTGLLVGFKPEKDAILQKYKSGEYTGFSIGGDEISVTEVNDA